jgi:methylated-DNA-[protein]-cysteine S-methyltransferase
MARSTKRSTGEPHRQELDLCGRFVFETSFGWVATNWGNGQLHDLVFGYESPHQAVAAVQSENADVAEVIEPTADAEHFADRLRAYLGGEPDDFRDVSIALDANTEFQRNVLGLCRKIPYGQTWSYAKLAQAAGSPRACRAVGNIMARNRIPLIIPCHRVVGSHGSLGGYSAPSGLSLKRQLLQLEGAQIMA